MAINSRKSGTSRVGLISIILIYILLIALIIYLTGEILLDLPSGRNISNFIIIPVAFILPIALLISVFYNGWKLYIEIKNGSPGARLKTHLVLFFTLIVLMSSLPQSLVSLKFVNTAIQTWFSPEIGTAIDGGLNLALAYYNEKIETLEAFSEGPVFINMLSDIERAPRRMWTNISNANPGLDAIQIFDSGGRPVFFGGDPKAELQEMPTLGGATGLLPREDRGETSLLRYLQIQSINISSYNIIVSTLLPKNLDDTARSLTDAREVFLNYQRNQKQFSTLLYFFYAFFTLPLILISILISFLLSDEIIRPIVSLEAATRRVADGDYSYRILTRSGDELSNLIRSFNKMMGELDNSRKKILQTEKITAWQEIARQLAHELRNPLTPIKLSSERILRKYRTDPENIGKIIEAAVPGIIQEVNALDNMLREFRDFSQLPSPTLRSENLSALLAETVESYRNSYPGIIFIFEKDGPDIQLEIDPEQMKRVFSNLVKNACESIEERTGKISIQTDLVRKGNSSYCRIRIQDTGTGIDIENHEQVFNPYFTTKLEGSGLGLPIVERIIFDHKGQIWFETDKGHGTTFFIDLPMETLLG
ncbi:MAG: HAMP domain-containing protein [Spirochaetales bacterium]|nr:HAMP domain-containing protein [Spirochaetales bacterium]